MFNLDNCSGMLVHLYLPIRHGPSRMERRYSIRFNEFTSVQFQTMIYPKPLMINMKSKMLKPAIIKYNLQTL